MTRRAAAHPLAALALLLAGVAGHAEGYFYSYWKQQMPLALEPQRIAVFRADDVNLRNQPALVQSLALHGIDPVTVRSIEVGGWTSVGMPIGAGRDAAATERAVADLAADPAFDFVTPVFADSYGPVLVSPSILMKFKDGVSRQRADAILAELHAGAIAEADYQNFAGLMRVDSGSRNGFETLDRANALAAHAEVEFAHPDLMMTVQKHLIPNDQFFSSQWGLRNQAFPGIDVGATAAWDTTIGSPSVIVAVIDDGVQQDHPDINQVQGVDFTGSGTNGGPGSSCDRHGTAVAGCVSAIINNSIGVVGVAPGAKVAGLKYNNAVTPCNGSGTFFISWLTSAISWAQSNAKVTNNSNGFSPNSAVDIAYSSAYNAGVVNFASSGNGGNGTIGYPASSPRVNAVGAITIGGARASFSQFGAGLRFVAPGQGIWTTDRTGAEGFFSGDYGSLDGTSFSSPIAAGVAALVFSRFPSFSPAQVEFQMQQTATRLGPGPYPNSEFGYGLVRADRAIQQLCAPFIGSSPTSVLVASGASASFTVTVASGTAPFTYTWFRNGSQVNNGGPYSGATTATLTINPATAATVGTYFARVSNSCGSADSDTATLTIGCPGDTNGDNIVNFADLNAVLGQFGQTGPGLAADVNGDGTVNFADLNIVLSNFGRTC